MNSLKREMCAVNHYYEAYTLNKNAENLQILKDTITDLIDAIEEERGQL